MFVFKVSTFWLIALYGMVYPGSVESVECPVWLNGCNEPNGVCDSLTGQCSCDPMSGYEGYDCSTSTNSGSEETTCPSSFSTVHNQYLQCTGNGICDTTTGECTCDLTKGISADSYDCSKYDCPGDGYCSNHGNCDDTTGICSCDVGYEGNACQANECKDSQPASWINLTNGNLCDKYVGPWNLCDYAWRYCDYKKCKEFCKTTCNIC